MEGESMRKPRIAARPIADDYLNLIIRFPLRKIRTRADHRAAMDVLNELMLKGEENLTDGEEAYLDVLAGLVDAYEREKIRPQMGAATPLEMLQTLMEANDLSPGQLGKIIGSASAATMILKGEREMSKAHIRKIADRFHVSPALFL
jgi:HTH-type transcriptional regulator/antitoxin HigA